MSLAVVVRGSFLVAGLAAVVTVAGCGAAPGEDVGQTSEAVGFANDKAAFDYFLGKGLANFQAAGIVGNLDQESGVDPTAVQAGGPGRGIAQWSVGGRWDTDANDNATWYAGQQGQSVDSLQLQLDFIWYELTTFSGYGLAALQASTNVTDATVAFQNDFEGCGTCDQSTRISYAQSVLGLYGNDAVDGGGSVDAGSGGVPCTVPGVGTGECILTTDCAAIPGHVSTPGYCPGAADIQCCTGPTVDAGGGSSSGGGDAGGKGGDAGGTSSGSSSGTAGGSSSGSAGTSSGGTGSSSGASSGGASGSGGAGADGGAVGNEAWSEHGGSGCSTAPGGAGGSLAGLGLVGLVGIAARRRRGRAR